MGPTTFLLFQRILVSFFESFFSSVVCIVSVSSKFCLPPYPPPVWSMSLMLETFLKCLVILGYLSVFKRMGKKLIFMGREKPDEW